MSTIELIVADWLRYLFLGSIPYGYVT